MKLKMHSDANRGLTVIFLSISFFWFLKYVKSGLGQNQVLPAEREIFWRSDFDILQTDNDDDETYKLSFPEKVLTAIWHNRKS